jgi:uncharacterized DUF497 family protein
MRFAWPEPKPATNLEKHGLDFADAEQVLNGPTFTIEDAGGYNGEQRFNTTGFLDSGIVTICHTETAEEIHMIFMRKAEPHEIGILAHYLQDDPTEGRPDGRSARTFRCSSPREARQAACLDHA